MKNTIAVIGKSGTGKTRKVLFNEVETEIKGNNNLLIVDDELDYYNHFKKELEKNKYEIKVINFEEPTKSDGFDPLVYIKGLYNEGKVDKAVEQAKYLAYDFIDRPDGVDPFWSSMASDYFAGVALTTLKTNSKNVGFCSILNVVLQGEEKYKDSTYMETYVNTLKHTDPEYILLSGTILSPLETRASILSVLKQNINPYFTRGELVKSFNNHTFEVEELKKDKKCAIFVKGYNKINRLTNVVINQVFDMVKSNNIQMTFILDNFDELSKLANIREMINTANNGKYHMRLLMTCKDKEYLDNEYKSFTFNNVEEVIELTDKYEVEVNDKEDDLPELGNKEIDYIDFKEIVKSL